MSRVGAAWALLALTGTLIVGLLLARAVDRRRQAETRSAAIEAGLETGRVLDRQLGLLQSRALAWAAEQGWQTPSGSSSWPDAERVGNATIHGALLDENGRLVASCEHLVDEGPWGFGEDGQTPREELGILYSVRNEAFLFAATPVGASGVTVLAAAEAESVARVASLASQARRGFAHEIWARDLLSGERTLVHRSPEPLGEASVELPLSAAGDAWTLEVATSRRSAGLPPTKTRAALALILGLVVGGAVYEVANKLDRLRRELRTQGAELATANRRVLQEVELRQRMSDQISFNAIHDGLTQLPNQREFVHRIDRALGRIRTGGEGGFCVLMVGLDRFRSVNETLGEKYGDVLLTLVARRLGASIRPGDTVARVGGDKFGLLLYGVEGEEGADASAQRVLEIMAQPFEEGDHTTYLTVSIGIASAETGYEGARDIFRHAELAMYQAKAMRAGGAVRFEPAAGEEVASVLQLETDLRRAIEREEFELYYQPIVAAAGGELQGMEVLIRWNHPLEGTVPPGKFLPLAEDLGLISPINRWVLRRAADQAVHWWREHPEKQFYLSFNATASDLERESFCDYITQVMSETGLPPGALRVEITESIILQDLSAASRLLGRLNDQGVRILLDDFGTGYSSLSYLHRLPIHTLKIDRSFINMLCERERDREIVRAIINMAGALRIKTIAEGIEDRETLAILQSMKCDAVQGFYFSRPVPGSIAENWLNEERWRQFHRERLAS